MSVVRLFNMRPMFAGDDIGDRRWVNSKHLAYSVLIYPARIKSANLWYVRIDQLSHASFLASMIAVLASLKSIAGIIHSCAQVQMIRSYAWRVVALVKYPQAVRNRAVANFPRGAMCSNGMAIVFEKSIASPDELIASPLPALAQMSVDNRATLINLIPKAIYEWYFRCSHDLNLLNRWFSIVVRPARVCKHSFGPFSILAQEGILG